MSLLFSRQRTFKEKLHALFFSAGVQALVLFRLSNYLVKYRLARILRLPVILYRLNQFLCGVDIEPTATIGLNFLMPHPSGIVIGSTAVIGNYCTMMQNSTIGTRNMNMPGEKRHATVEDHVFIGPNVVILGDVTIRKSARLGAGSVVLADVEENQTIVGIYSETGNQWK